MNNMHKVLWTWLPLLVIASLVISGCASRAYVGSEVGSSRAKLGEQMATLGSQVEVNQKRIAEHGVRITDASATAKEALERALAAGRLAEGRIVYERILTDDTLRFAFDRADLGEEAHSALAGFADEITTENADVFIEIQGHTDSIGTEAYNDRLGELRADAVLRFLNEEYSIPLHRMSVISYGESAPVAENTNREHRALNRRVALVVLR